MSGPDPGNALRADLAAAGVRARRARRSALAPAAELAVRPRDWREAARTARAADLRLASLWVDERGRSLLATALLERGGGYVALRTRVRIGEAELASIADVYPAADRLERHARDLWGLEFTNAPDARRWTRHQAWAEDEHPLRGEFPVAGRDRGDTPPDADYPCQSASGSGVYEIPVGPVHAGIIEPGHFRFLAVGEEVLSLEERLGYLHKGIEKIAVGRDPAGLARLAARVSGDSAVAHAWAACMAMERAAGVEPPPRALALRAVLAERERVVNHLWDLAAIANDVGFAFPYFALGRLVEDWRRVNAGLLGHRLLMDTVVAGGVSVDLEPEGAGTVVEQCRATRAELDAVWTIMQENTSLHDRLGGTGVLSPDDARDLGALGYVGRASGRDFDVRRDAPYPPYDRLAVEAPCLAHGDVAARARVRHLEAIASLDLLERLCAHLPEGETVTPLPEPHADAEGLGIVDGWRGEVVSAVRFGPRGRVARFFPRDPSWLNWPALERLIHGNIVPDFPVCNKSVNGSYAGCDL